MSILSKTYEVPKSMVSAAFSKAGEVISSTAKDTGSQIVDTVSSTAKPTWDYITTVASKAPGSFKEDVVDSTLSDMSFNGFMTSPIKSTAKAIFSPALAIPRAGWSVLKSGWSMTSTAVTESPKLLWDTTTTALGGGVKILGTGAKGLTGLASAGLAAVDAGIDAAVGSGSKSEAKK